MSRFKGIAVSLFMSAYLIGCAIPPDQKTVTQIDTYDIVKHIRCEMRDALRLIARNAMEDEKIPLWRTLNSDGDWIMLGKTPLPQNVDWGPFLDTVIGYDFTFDVSESNNALAHADVLHTFSRGTLGLGLQASANRTRNNIESFRIVDTFQKLALRVNDKYCDDKLPGSNQIHPIAGQLNLKTYALKFMDMALSGNLTDSADGTEVAKYSLTLKFTTELSSGLTPDADFPTRKESWELVGINGELTNSRTDIHQVAIVFLLKKPGHKQADTLAEQRVKDELDFIRTRDALASYRRD